jgi:hypothetical protein
MAESYPDVDETIRAATESTRAAIEAVDFVVKKLEHLDPNSPAAADYRNRLWDMKGSLEQAIRELEGQLNWPSRDRFIAMLAQALAKIPNVAGGKNSLQ